MSTEHKSNTAENIKDCWQTPKGLFKTLDNEFSFDCDVAASQENTLCKFWFDENDSALKQKWCGVNWCNPPYSDVTPWIEKATEQHQRGRTIVMLVPADTSVQWFKLAEETCTEIRFITGRLSFINAETQKPVNGNNKGSVLIIWRAYAPKNHSMILVNRDDLL